MVGWGDGAGQLLVPGRPTTLEYGRAGACCACSRCGTGGLFLVVVCFCFFLLFFCFVVVVVCLFLFVFFLFVFVFFVISSILSSFSNASSVGDGWTF